MTWQGMRARAARMDVALVARVAWRGVVAATLVLLVVTERDGQARAACVEVLLRLFAS